MHLVCLDAFGFDFSVPKINRHCYRSDMRERPPAVRQQPGYRQPASEVSQAEIQAVCANEQLCGFLLSKFQSAVRESGSEVKLAQWVQAMESIWAETHNRLRLKEEKLVRAWGPVTDDGDEDRLWAKVSEMLTETCSRPEGFNPKSWAEQCWSAAKLIQEWVGVPMLDALGRHVTAVQAMI